MFTEKEEKLAAKIYSYLIAETVLGPNATSLNSAQEKAVDYANFSIEAAGIFGRVMRQHLTRPSE